MAVKFKLTKDDKVNEEANPGEVHGFEFYSKPVPHNCLLVQHAPDIEDSCDRQVHQMKRRLLKRRRYDPERHEKDPYYALEQVEEE